MSRRQIGTAELREIQLGILDAVDDFCTARGLRYSLGGGTLLGAVRHKGYIPWDDDIDIMLPRPDYERLLREFPAATHHYVIHNYHTDSSYFQAFTKIYDDRTVLKEYGIIDGCARPVYDTGVNIEVFPVDGLPAPDEMDAYMDGLSECMVHLSNSTLFRYFSPLQRLKHYLKLMVYRHVDIRLKKSRRDSITGLEEYLKSYDFNTSDYAGAITGIYGLKEHMEADVFRHYTLLPFEGREYMAIADYDAYLTRHYGDYMQLPPVNCRKSGHIFKAYWR